MASILLLLFSTSIPTFLCWDISITVNVEPLKEDCFFQTLKATDQLEIEYQVIDGGHGDLDISFSMVEPRGRIVVADFKKPEKSHDVKIEVAGDYKFCFDNTFSAFNTKTVFFELSAYNSDEDDQWDNSDISFDNSVSNADFQQIEVFNAVVEAVRDHLTKARTLQDLIKITEAKDRNIGEQTFFKVNTCSVVVLATMVFVSLVQILMVKSIFDNNSKICKLLCFLDFSK
ncbi:transmembrane emp24 domain-containing protein 5-like [Euwallacea fornicatus]|uniref:transmembrane emp24 domain-containing protein 5-like n=1 Tax=Euwallacea fornicatus TaxID=995702 RepID=UPI00338D763A